MGRRSSMKDTVLHAIAFSNTLQLGKRAEHGRNREPGGRAASAIIASASRARARCTYGRT